MRRSLVVSLALVLVSCRDAVEPGPSIATTSQTSRLTSQWTPTGEMVFARRAFATAAASGRIFVFGGFGRPAGELESQVPKTLNTAEMYDPATDTWTPIRPMLGPRRVTSAALGGDGRIYVAGGWSDPNMYNRAVVAYDPRTDSYEKVGELMSPRVGPALAGGQDGRVYIIGGQGPDATHATTDVYDPFSGVWWTIAPMRIARTWHAAATGPDFRIYVMGGLTANAEPVASSEAYDLRTNTWSPIADMPEPRWAHAAVTGEDGRVYVLGGATRTEVDHLVPLNDVIAYDPGTNSWSSVPAMTTARYALGAANINGRIYAVGGWDGAALLNSGEWLDIAIPVSIDVRPGDGDNPINRRAKGAVPVALLSSATFDARSADRGSVTFAGAPAAANGGGEEDVNGDGLADVIFHFRTDALELAPESASACLSGRTTSGLAFKGCDAVRVIK